MMPSLGVDYSYARPGGAVLARLGVKGAGRYLADQGDGRQIERPEFDDLTRNGVAVWFVREGAATGMLGGQGKGVSDARIAVGNLARLGLNDQVVYAAADWDVTAAQFPACDDYMAGFASVIGAERTGIYGGLYYLNHCHQAGLAKWFWQAGATSWNHGQKPAMTVHLEQTVRTPPAPGTDHNFIYTDDYGQAGPRLTDLTTQEDDMIFIKSPGRPAALIGAGVAELPNDEYAQVGRALASKVLDGLNDRQYDVARSIAEAMAPELAAGASQSPLDNAAVLGAVAGVPQAVAALLASKLG